MSGGYIVEQPPGVFTLAASAPGGGPGYTFALPNGMAFQTSGAPITQTTNNGASSGISGGNYSITTGNGGGGSSNGGDYIVTLGAGTGTGNGTTTARAGQLIVNSTATIANITSTYDGAVFITQTNNFTTTQPSVRQALDVLCILNGDGANYNGANQVAQAAMELREISNITGTTTTNLFYAAECQWIHSGTATIGSATAIQGDTFLTSTGNVTTFYNFTAQVGPYTGGGVVTNVRCYNAGQDLFQNSGSSHLNNDAFFSAMTYGSPAGSDTAGGYFITGFFAPMPSQGGNTSGTNANNGLWISNSRIANAGGGSAGAGGTVNNIALNISVPNAASGPSTSVTYNYGIQLAGNGGTPGSGTLHNWALVSTSTAESFFAGPVGFGYNNAGSVFTNGGPLIYLLPTETLASGAGATWDGFLLAASTLTLSGNTHVTTARGLNAVTLLAPTISAALALTVDQAATLEVDGPPVAGGAGPVTITNTMSVYVRTGGVVVGAATGFAGNGTGTINVSVGVYLNNTAYTNPGFVFEHWATGAVKKYADQPMALDYTGRLSIAETESYVRDHYELPGFDPKHDLFRRAAFTLMKAEEAWIGLFEHEREIGALKARIATLTDRIAHLDVQ